MSMGESQKEKSSTRCHIQELPKGLDDVDLQLLEAALLCSDNVIVEARTHKALPAMSALFFDLSFIVTKHSI